MNFEQFYMRNYPIVFGYLYSLSADKVMAEDLTSETFLVAIRKGDEYDWNQKPASLLCTIAKNLFLNEQRRRKHHVSLEDVIIPSGQDLETEIIEAQLAKQIQRLAVTLSENQQTVFSMRLTGLSFREIGDAMGKSENWARVNYFRAKNEILKRLEGEK